MASDGSVVIEIEADASDAKKELESVKEEAKQIIQQIRGLDGRIGTVELTAEGLETRIQGLDGKYTALEQTVDGFSTRVSGLDGKYSELKQTVDGFTVSGPSGSTMIKGSSIETGSLKLTGVITWDDLDSGVQGRFTDGVTEEIVHTLIKDDLVQSPRIEGAEIFGGEYHDINGAATLRLTRQDQSGHPSLFYSTADDFQIFNVYYNEGTIIHPDQSQETIRYAIMALGGYPIMYVTNRNTTVTAEGNWFFSGTVSGMTGLSIAEEAEAPTAQSDVGMGDGPGFEVQSPDTPPKKVDFKQVNGELKISLPDGTDWYLGTDGWHK